MALAPKVVADVHDAVSSVAGDRHLPIGRILAIGMAIAILVGIFVYLKDRPLEALPAMGPAASRAESRDTVAARKTEPPPPAKLSPGEIASKYADAVVVLENFNDQGQRASQGSGFISSASGLVLTNYHVIRGASRMSARTHDESSHEVEYVVGFDAQHDIAVLKIGGENLGTVQLGNSSAVKTGDHVTVLGAPLGLESTLSDGIVSAVRTAGSFRLFQTSAPISHGSSGGPLFDDYGSVIGLAVSALEAGENLNFAVPIDSAKPLLKAGRQMSFRELLSETAVHKPVLASSVSLPPQVTTLDITVPPQGGTLAGTFSIVGGFGNDLGMSLVSASGELMWHGGIVRHSGNVNLRLRGGQYKLVLNNKMGPFWISQKTLSGTIELSFYR